ncbi:unnamed protein product [Polarella glacialis]|uniref:Uncharacterized protein n=1 Tax=Polarella glacialis TaxID=89957 RepID=A0A813GE24_POLGL|nr:unnamed protein product [Polarella glacialis]
MGPLGWDRYRRWFGRSVGIHSPVVPHATLLHAFWHGVQGRSNSRSRDPSCCVTCGALAIFVLLLFPVLDKLAGFQPWTLAYWADPFQQLFLTHQSVSWYLRCLIVWRLESWLLHEFAAWKQMVFVLILGTLASINSSESGIGQAACLRTATLAPFFFAGKHIDWDWMAGKIPSLQTWMMLGAWAAFLTFVASWQALHLDQYIIGQVEGFPNPFVGSADGAAPHLLKGSVGYTVRYLADLMMRGCMALTLFYCCVPRGETVFTKSGALTMYPYLLHKHFITCVLSGLVTRPAWSVVCSGSNGSDLGCIVMSLLILLASFAVTFFLTLAPARILFGWALEPTWLLPERLRQETKG